jgi:hypothetical protein
MRNLSSIDRLFIKYPNKLWDPNHLIRNNNFSHHMIETDQFVTLVERYSLNREFKWWYLIKYRPAPNYINTLFKLKLDSLQNIRNFPPREGMLCEYMFSNKYAEANLGINCNHQYSADMQKYITTNLIKYNKFLSTGFIMKNFDQIFANGNLFLQDNIDFPPILRRIDVTPPMHNHEIWSNPNIPLSYANKYFSRINFSKFANNKNFTYNENSYNHNLCQFMSNYTKYIKTHKQINSQLHRALNKYVDLSILHKYNLIFTPEILFSGETKNINILFYNNFSQKFKKIPEINVFDDTNIIEKNIDKYDWKTPITSDENAFAGLIDKYYTSVDWCNLSQNPQLSENIVEKYINKLDFELISKYK